MPGARHQLLYKWIFHMLVDKVAGIDFAVDQCHSEKKCHAESSLESALRPLPYKWIWFQITVDEFDGFRSDRLFLY